LGYPEAAEEVKMCERAQSQHPIEALTAVSHAAEILKCQRSVRAIRVSPAVCDYLVRLTRATRQHPALRLGASPRGSLGLFHLAQALAAIQGSDDVSVFHIQTVAEAVLAHRLLLRHEAQPDYPDGAAVIRELVVRTAVAA
jgi:MoxR-like ATPase